MADLSFMRQRCRDRARDAFGTSYIFGRRSTKFKRRLRMLSFLGIAGPLLLGAVLGAFGLKFPHLEPLVAIAAVVGIVQLLASGWSLVAKWDDQFAYSQESKGANYQLYIEYKDLAEEMSLSDQEFKGRYDLLNTESKFRDNEDSKQGLNDEELRIGMRAALRQMNLKCPTCDIQPVSMDPKSCGSCGNFKLQNY